MENNINIEDSSEIQISENNIRTARSSSSREARSRKSEERSPVVFGGGSRFNLPMSIVNKLKDAGKVAGFVVYSSGNTEQKENYYDAVDRGWKPMNADDFPELVRQYELSPFGNREEDRLIRRGGQIAMIRDIETHIAEKDYYDAEKRRQQYMSEMYKQEDPRLPKPFLDERKRSLMR